jgi:hypothetical protein
MWKKEDLDRVLPALVPGCGKRCNYSANVPRHCSSQWGGHVCPVPNGGQCHKIRKDIDRSFPADYSLLTVPPLHQHYPQNEPPPIPGAIRGPGTGTYVDKRGGFDRVRMAPVGTEGTECFCPLIFDQLCPFKLDQALIKEPSFEYKGQ